MLKASAPQKRMRRGSWCFDVVLVLDHLSIILFGSTTTAADGPTCRKRRCGIWVFLFGGGGFYCSGSEVDSGEAGL